MTDIEIRHGHIFCGLGGGAKGFNEGDARVGNTRARFRCLGGIDVDPAAIKDFNRLAGARSTLLDLFSRQQYIDFHGHDPDGDWREATPADIHRAFNNEWPHIVFLSAPCKGFSGLLPEKMSKSRRYQALNGLTLRGIWLMLEAYKDDPIELVVFENVPRIATRGRPLLDQIVGLLKSYGYAVAETTHDCGELGGLAQSRKRFLLVARHREKVPPYLYQPIKRPLLGVGDVIGKLPLPGPDPILPMHRVPNLQWKTWVRLAFVEAGSDWRSLKKLNVEEGFLTDFGIVPEPEVDWSTGALGVLDWEKHSNTVTARCTPGNGWFNVADPRSFDFYHKGSMGVRAWDQPGFTVRGRAGPTNGGFSVADPRIDGHPKSVQNGVRRWDKPAPVVTGKMFVGGGPHSVADPRMPESKNRQNGIYRVVRFDSASGAVTGAKHVAGAAMSVADPRAGSGFGGKGKYRVVNHDEPSGTVIAASTTGNGAFALADPRCNWNDNAHQNKLRLVPWEDAVGTVTGSRAPYSGGSSVADPRPGINDEIYKTQGYYGVVPWWDQVGAVTASVCHDNGKWSVADPREGLSFAPSFEVEEIKPLPDPSDQVFAMIRALDGTWHRPFTTLELAALQGLVDPEEKLELDGTSDSAWRERIGNAVPPPAAQAIASVCGRTLLLAWAGESFMLSMEEIWVRDVAVGLSVHQGETP